jgi:hypothetical protein
MVNAAFIRVPSELTVTPETCIPAGVTLTVGVAPKPEPEMATAEMPPACPVLGTMLVIPSTVPVPVGVTVSRVLVQPCSGPVGLKCQDSPTNDVLKFDFPAARPVIVELDVPVVSDTISGFWIVHDKTSKGSMDSPPSQMFSYSTSVVAEVSPPTGTKGVPGSTNAVMKDRGQSQLVSVKGMMTPEDRLLVSARPISRSVPSPRMELHSNCPVVTLLASFTP